MRKTLIGLVAGGVLLLAAGSAQATPPFLYTVTQNRDVSIQKVVQRSVPLPIPTGENAAQSHEEPGGPPVTL